MNNTGSQRSSSGLFVGRPFYFLLSANAKRLSLLAGVVWVMSLPLAGIVQYADQKVLRGYEILLSGWLSLLVVNFAWLANPLFVIAILRLLSGGTATRPSVLAVFFSLDTIRFSSVVLNEGGASTPGYGYGWGAILWFLSLFLIMSAAGTRQSEAEAEGAPEHWGKQLRTTGLVLCVLAVGLTALLAVRDRVLANSSEQDRLSGIAFKRYSVCSVNDPEVRVPILGSSGRLEVKPVSDTILAKYPFLQPKILLSWGIPVVRFGRRDYSLISHKDEELLVSSPASGSVTATLFVSETTGRGSQQQIHVKMVEATSERIVFEQTWKQETGGARFCPEYKSWPNVAEQPRRVILEALILPLAPSISSKTRRKEAFENTAEAVVLSATKVAEPRPMPHEWWKKQPVAKEKVSRHETYNTNCPKHIGREGEKSENEIVRLSTGWPFEVGDKSYYPERRLYQSTCVGEFVFLYSGGLRNGKYYLTLEKRQLSEFRRIWTGMVVIPSDMPASPNSSFQVHAVREDQEGVTITLADKNGGYVSVVRAPLNTTPIQ